jgi:hypothetical protein
LTCPIQTAITLLNRTEFPEKSGQNFRNPQLRGKVCADEEPQPPDHVIDGHGEGVVMKCPAIRFDRSTDGILTIDEGQACLSWEAAGLVSVAELGG